LIYCLIALMQKIASIRPCLIDNSKYSTIKFDGELLRYRPKSQMRTYERKTRNAQIAATCRSVFKFLLLESEHSSRLCIFVPLLLKDICSSRVAFHVFFSEIKIFQKIIKRNSLEIFNIIIILFIAI